MTQGFDYFRVTQDDVDNAYKAGAASRQAEIDALKVMIRKLVDNTIIGIDDELENQANDILKGDSND